MGDGGPGGGEISPANDRSDATGYFDWEHAGDRVHLSDRAAELYGFTVAEARAGIPHQEITDRIHYDDRPAIVEAISAQRPGFFKRQYRVQHPRDGIVTLRVRGYSFVDNEGLPQRRIGTVDLVDASGDADRLAAMIDQTLASYEMAAGRPFLQYLFGMALAEMGLDLAQQS